MRNIEKNFQTLDTKIEYFINILLQNTHHLPKLS